MKQNFGKYISVVFVVLVCIVGVSISSATEQSQEQANFVTMNPGLESANTSTIELNRGEAVNYTLLSDIGYPLESVLYAPSGLTESDAKQIKKENDKTVQRLGREKARNVQQEIEKIQAEESGIDRQSRSKNGVCTDGGNYASGSDPKKYGSLTTIAAAVSYAHRYVCLFEYLEIDGAGSTSWSGSGNVESIQTIVEICINGVSVSGASIAVPPGAKVSVGVTSACANFSGDRRSGNSQTVWYGTMKAKSAINLGGTKQTTVGSFVIDGDYWNVINYLNNSPTARH